MSVIIKNTEIVHYGEYTDENGDVFEFTATIDEVNGEQTWLEIKWLGKEPEDKEEAEEIISDMV